EINQLTHFRRRNSNQEMRTFRQWFVQLHLQCNRVSGVKMGIWVIHLYGGALLRLSKCAGQKKDECYQQRLHCPSPEMVCNALTLCPHWVCDGLRSCCMAK